MGGNFKKQNNRKVGVGDNFLTFKFESIIINSPGKVLTRPAPEAPLGVLGSGTHGVSELRSWRGSEFVSRSSQFVLLGLLPQSVHCWHEDALAVGGALNLLFSSLMKFENNGAEKRQRGRSRESPILRGFSIYVNFF